MALALRVRTNFTYRDPDSGDRTEFQIGELIADPKLVESLPGSEQGHFVHKTLLDEDHPVVLPHLPDDHPAVMRFMKAVRDGQAKGKIVADPAGDRAKAAAAAAAPAPAPDAPKA